MYTRLGFIIAFVIALIAVCCPARASEPQIVKPMTLQVGIFGDVHSELELAGEVLDRMRTEGVTHIIGTGDFIERGGAASLEAVLKLIGERTGVPRERIFLMPGNWEAMLKREEYLPLLRQYGQLITDAYDKHGYVEIEGRKIFVSHYPQYPVPIELLPEARFLARTPGQAFVMDTMARKLRPEPGTSLEIFGHTHRSGIFTNPATGNLAVNPGVLNPGRKSAAEPLAFALFDPSTNEVRILDAKTGSVLQSARSYPRSFGRLRIDSDGRVLMKLNGSRGEASLGKLEVPEKALVLYRWNGEAQARDLFGSGSVTPEHMRETLARSTRSAQGSGLYLSSDAWDSQRYSTHLVVSEMRPGIRQLNTRNAELKPPWTLWGELAPELSGLGLHAIVTPSGKKGEGNWYSVTSHEAIQSVRRPTMSDFEASRAFQAGDLTIADFLKIDHQGALADSPALGRVYPLASRLLRGEALSDVESRQILDSLHHGLRRYHELSAGAGWSDGFAQGSSPFKDSLRRALGARWTSLIQGNCVLRAVRGELSHP